MAMLVAVWMIKKIDDITSQNRPHTNWVAVWMIKKIDDITAICRSIVKWVAVWMIKKIDDIKIEELETELELQFEWLKRLTIFITRGLNSRS